jgi:hypothetical protein
MRKKNPDLMYHTFPNLGQNINTKDRFGQFQVQDRRKLWEIKLKMGIVVGSHHLRANWLIAE